MLYYICVIIDILNVSFYDGLYCLLLNCMWNLFVKHYVKKVDNEVRFNKITKTKWLVLSVWTIQVSLTVWEY